jgi:hypothetical protein
MALAKKWKILNSSAIRSSLTNGVVPVILKSLQHQFAKSAHMRRLEAAFTLH